MACHRSLEHCKITIRLILLSKTIINPSKEECSIYIVLYNCSFQTRSPYKNTEHIKINTV